MSRFGDDGVSAQAFDFACESFAAFDIGDYVRPCLMRQNRFGEYGQQRIRINEISARIKDAQPVRIAVENQS